MGKETKNRRPWPLCSCIVAATLICSTSTVLQSEAEDADAGRALVSFMRALHSDGNSIRNSWNSTADACSGTWKGITCNSRSRVFRVVLENMRLDGTIDAAALCSRVKTLRVLSLKDNRLRGGIPGQISRCGRMTHLYLAGNQLTGTLPPSLSEMKHLKVLDLSGNRFTGPLPAGMSGLLRLRVENNRLSGGLGGLATSGLAEFNVSNNNFTGRIPSSIGARFAEGSVYAGNPGLCGRPLLPCPAGPPVQTPLPSAGRSRVPGIVAKWAGYAALAVVIAFAFAFLVFYRRKYCPITNTNNNNNNSISSSSRTGKEISSKSASSSASSLIFLDKTRRPVKFEDMLRASAELLGKGSFASLYRVLMEDGTALAVKRIGDVAASGHAFQRRMELVGRLKHPNVLPLLAYYCSKEEKLLVYEFQPNGSISALLHGHLGDRKLDWRARLGVASGVAAGLAYIHREFESQNIPHGNLKSSNVLLNEDFEPRITECGLSFLQEVAGEPAPPGQQWGGYRAPECRRGRRITHKADVYSFGVLLLELLTGKMVEPAGLDLRKWVHSVVREEWTVEVFDGAMADESASEERMVSLLQIAVSCVSYSPESRPDMIHVARRIESLRDEEERSLERTFRSVSACNSSSEVHATGSSTEGRI